MDAEQAKGIPRPSIGWEKCVIRLAANLAVLSKAVHSINSGCADAFSSRANCMTLGEPFGNTLKTKRVKRRTALAAIAEGAIEYDTAIRRTHVFPILCSHAYVNGGCLAFAESPLMSKKAFLPRASNARKVGLPTAMPTAVFAASLWVDLRGLKKRSAPQKPIT